MHAVLLLITDSVHTVYVLSCRFVCLFRSPISYESFSLSLGLITPQFSVPNCTNSVICHLLLAHILQLIDIDCFDHPVNVNHHL